MRTHARPFLFAAWLLVVSASGTGSSVPIASSDDAPRTEILQLRAEIGDADRLRAANLAANAEHAALDSAEESSERPGSDAEDAAGDAEDAGRDEVEDERGAEAGADGDAGEPSDPAC